MDAQALWWIKVLRDDPLRIVRALRFCAKFGFKLHDAFWSAVPFANDALRVKVAGNRKLTEILKIAKYGPDRLQSFLQLACSRQFTTGTGTCVLAPAMFGGVPALPGKKSRKKKDSSATEQSRGPLRVCTLSHVEDFDTHSFQILCASMSGYRGLRPDESLGLHFAAALLCTRVASESTMSDIEIASNNFHCCCDGLSSSNSMRQAGHSTLEAVLELQRVGDEIQKGTVSDDGAKSDIGTVHSEDVPFSKAAGISARDFRVHTTVWKCLQAGKPQSNWLKARASLVVAMLGMNMANDSRVGAKAGSTAVSKTIPALVKDAYELLIQNKIKISGRALATLDILPRHMYATFLSRLYVLINLISPDATDMSTPDSLSAFLTAYTPQLVEELKNVWYSDENTLREAFQRPNKKKQKR